MKKIAHFTLMIALTITSATLFTSCKKGQDDPIVSLQSRTARISNFWTLNEYKENGATQSMDGNTVTLDIDKNGTFRQESEGTIFGVQTSDSFTGSWEFVDDKESVRFTNEEGSNTYTIDRLSNNDLWLRQIQGSDVYEYIFEDR